jgi:hypothetical protein
MSSRQRTLVRGTLATLGAAGLLLMVGVLASVPPTADSLYPKCMLHQTTGLHCPGCGMTRSVHAALNGRFEQAFAYNVFAVVVVPYLALAGARWLWAWVWGLPPRPSRLPAGVRRWSPPVIGIVMVLFWVLRNVPVYPFTLLAPHELSP